MSHKVQSYTPQEAKWAATPNLQYRITWRDCLPQRPKAYKATRPLNLLTRLFTITSG